MTGKPAYLKFIVLIIISLAVGFLPLSRTFVLAVHSDEYTHILLVLPISVGLGFLARADIGLGVKRGTSLGIGLLIAAGIIAALAWREVFSAGLQLTLSMMAVVLWWIGAFVFCFGAHAARMLLFPLLFLFCMVPVPAVALEHVVTFLQSGSTSLTRIFFEIAGVPVSQNGFLLSIPGLDVQVAAECSSIRSSTMLLLTSLVLMHLFLRSWWGKLVFVLAAVPFSVIKNAIRIFTLTMLGTRVNPSFLTGPLHHQGGIVFFIVALMILIGLMRVLQWLEGRGPAHPRLNPVN